MVVRAVVGGQRLQVGVRLAGGLDTHLVSNPSTGAPIPAPSLPAALPWPQALETSAPPGSPPGCCTHPCLCPGCPPPTLTHATLPASPSLVSPVSLTPLVLTCLPCQSQRCAGEGHSDL